MSSLRIAMIGQRTVPARYGGVERAVEELSVRLVQRGHSVTAFCRAGEADAHQRQHRGVDLVRVASWGGKHTSALTQALLASGRARRGGFDVVHYHAMGPSLPAPLVRYGSSAAVVATIHGRDDRRAKWSLPARALLRLSLTTSTRVPHAVITVSRALRDELAAAGRASTYIPNGAPVPRSGELPDIGVQPGRYVLFVGRLVPEKAIHELIAAYRSVPTDWPLVIVGDSSWTAGYTGELTAQAALDARVRLVGRRRGRELGALYEHAAAFAFPSHLEGLPIALLEAAAFGVPVVASDIAPHVEIVRRDGPGRRLVPTGDVAALAGAIGETLADQPAARIGAAALAGEVRAAYDWDDVTERTEDVYRSAVARRHRSSRPGPTNRPGPAAQPVVTPREPAPYP